MIMWKNNVQTYKLKMTRRRMCIALLDTKGCKHILRICNTHWFSSATMVARTRFNVLYSTLHGLLKFWSLLLLCSEFRQSARFVPAFRKDTLPPSSWQNTSSWRLHNFPTWGCEHSRLEGITTRSPTIGKYFFFFGFKSNHDARNELLNQQIPHGGPWNRGAIGMDACLWLSYKCRKLCNVAGESISTLHNEGGF